VHRDIKPANLLVDVRCNLWITDFGLAHCQSQAGLTMTGDLVGTLRYMSPEQALAQPSGVNQHTDLYSLGATLYELLTLEPAFNGRDRQELLQQIAYEEPRPPRRINQAIPIELETIALKAMAKNPAERYARAQDLADDLERFLNDEPIRARRPTLRQRMRRWGRRHQPAVWSAAVGLLVALAALGGSIGWAVHDRNARQARSAMAGRLALDEAQRLFMAGKWTQAHAAAERAQALLRDGPADLVLAGQVQGLLRELTEKEADVQLVAALDELRFRRAEATDERFILEETLPKYRQAFAAYGLRPGALAPPDAAAMIRRRPAALQASLVAALDHWLLLARYQKAPEADWLERVLAAADTDHWRQDVRAARARNDRQALEKLARAVEVAAQPPEALVVLEHSLTKRGAGPVAVALLRRAQEAFPGDFWINYELGSALEDYQPPQHEEAIRFLMVAVALRPDSAHVRLQHGRALFRKGRLEEAIAVFHKAVELQPDFAEAHGKLGDALAGSGRLDEAIAAFQKAIELRPAYAEAYADLGSALWKKGRLDEAIVALSKALDAKPHYAEAHACLGNALVAKGRLDEAIAAVHRAIDLKPDCATAYYVLGNALRKKDRLAEAAAAYDRALALQPDHAEAYCNLGLTLWRQKKFTQALTALQQGHDLGSQRPDWHYPSAQWVKECRRLVELDGRQP
jgi:tetratricopeptide (TPR) repeat protein